MKNTLEECLHKYDMESLHAYCDEFDAPFREEEKDAVCASLAEELLKANVLLQRMGILDDISLQGLHNLAEGKEITDEDVLDHLDGLDLIYGSREEQKWLVPEEVKELFSYESMEWDLERRSRVWLMQCLTIIQHEWADAPMDIMMELYRKNPNVDPRADLKELFQEIPVSETTCVMIKDSFVIRGWRTSEVFAGYRQKQKKYSFYMPEIEEVLDLYQNDYDTRDVYGQKVKDWFLKNGAEEDDLQLLLHEMWNDMNYGHAEADIMKETESIIVYDTKQEQEQFRHMVHEWYIHVHRMDLRGHSIAEQKN